jgi:hypothetical protein
VSEAKWQLKQTKDPCSKRGGSDKAPSGNWSHEHGRVDLRTLTGLPATELISLSRATSRQRPASGPSATPVRWSARSSRPWPSWT